MTDVLEPLVQSLLYEGYALYPYTPGATKNATPTPFGIVYPPAYAQGGASTFDLLRVECVLEAPAGCEVDASVRFLQAAGSRHQAVERRVDLPSTPVAELLGGRRVGSEFAFDGEDGGVEGRARLRAMPLEGPYSRVAVCIHNTTVVGERLDRTAALRRSLLSTHVVLRARGGHFVSPLEREGRLGELVQGCRTVNSFPVLATPADDAVLGAAIVLPDHPQLAPESRGPLFDGTEIEEALLLHVHALSDAEREAIAEQDPMVREMIDRAIGTMPQDILDLHGRMELRDVPTMTEPSGPGAWDVAGEDEVDVDGETFRRGAKVVLRPTRGGDPMDMLLQGRVATIERIYIGYDDRAYFGVTVDDDPGQELLRDTGRYLFFFANELEVAPNDL